MRAKAFALLSFFTLALLVYLSSLALEANRHMYKDRLLVLPKSSNDSQQVNRLEEVNEEKFILTYEILQYRTVKALLSNYSAAIIGTNYAYPSVTGYPMITGGFFTKSAQDAKNYYAVLNETAAFNLFGSMQCDGETILIGDEIWLVVGVIDDGNTDDINVYIPATCTDNPVRGFIAKMDENGKNEIYVQNALKDAGVSENGSSFSNLDFLSKMPAQRLEVALESALCGFLLLAALFCVRLARENARALKRQLKQRYLREIVAGEPKHILRAAGAATAFLAAVAATLACMVRILDTCLRWDDKSSDFLALYSESFAANITCLQELLAKSGYSFAAVLILLGLILSLATGFVIKHGRAEN